MSKILIADDDQGMVTILAHILRAEGYDFDIVRDGLSARDKALSGGYDALIFDMHMPGMKGLDVLGILRAATPPVETPAILLSGSSPDEFLEPVQSLKRVQFMEKPFDLERLLAAIEDCVKK